MFFRDRMEMLDLYSNLQIHGDVAMYQTQSNIEKYCLKLSSDLMPHVAGTLISETVLTHNLDLQRAISLFDKLKKQIETSLEQSKLSKKHVASIKNHIKDVTLMTTNFSPLQYVEENYDGILSTNFVKNYLLLLNNYKKTLYSYAGQSVTAEIL